MPEEGLEEKTRCGTRWGNGIPFETDILPSILYSEAIKRKSQLEPEKRLMLAILENAVTDFQKYIHARDSVGRQKFREAKDYISKQDSNWLFSFENICEVLGLNPNYVRQGLIRWEEKQKSNSHSYKQQ